MFRPIRTSSPSKSSTAIPSSLRDDSRSTIPELMGLNQDEVAFIDAVIQRARPTANSFSDILNAYNELLEECGLESQNEVVYYGKLLKLGTMRGRNWGEKWAVIQQQNGYDNRQHVRHLSEDSVSTNATKPRHPLVARLAATHYNRPSKLDDDTFTLHSHEDDLQPATASPPETPRPKTRQILNTTRTAANPLVFDTSTPVRVPPRTQPTIGSTPRPARRPLLWESVSEAGTDEFVVGSSKKPLPGRSVITSRERSGLPLKTPAPLQPRAKSAPTVAAPTASHRAVAKAREQRSGTVNEEDAWKKIRMARDEEEADKFRQERLVERCWSVWRQGYEWSITTQEQIGQARDTLVLRLAMQRWRQLTASQLELSARVTSLSSGRTLRQAFTVWTARLAERRQIQWRRDMRIKMKIVREKREAKLCKDALSKWRQSFQSHLSDQHYKQRLVMRVLHRWHRVIAKRDHSKAIALKFDEVRESRSLDRTWEAWRRALDTRTREAAMVKRVGLRVMADGFEIWRKRTSQVHNADDFYNVICMKRAIGAWRGARLQVQTMEARADKHLARQDGVLVRAIVRVWKAHERGKLLERVRDSRLEHRLWDVWKHRLQGQRQHEELAIAFSLRQNSVLATDALRTWLNAYATRLSAQRFADQFHATHLQHQMFFLWRRAVRKKQKIARAARVAEKYLVLRRTWNAWRERVAASKRDKKVKELDVMRTTRLFNYWSGRVRRQKQLRSAEKQVQEMVSTRSMKMALGRWTTRVIAMKLREIEIVQKSDALLVSTIFRKWKGVCIRHAEELSLLQSYLDVKREETIRRMFYNWLNKGRSARSLRLTLQEREDQIRMDKLAAAWEQWRDRYKNERLRVVESEVVLQAQRNLLFRSFGVWHSKTHSLPAVHFEASHLKARVWRRWRNSMPKASLAKMARDVHTRSMLSKTLVKWTQAHKTKISLKAVARARYLRLPTAVPRQNLSASRPTPPASVAVGRAFTRRVLMASALAKESQLPSLDESASQASAPAALSSNGRRPIARTREAAPTDEEETEAEDIRPKPTYRASSHRPFRPSSLSGSNDVYSSISRAGLGASPLTPASRPRLYAMRDSSPARSKASSALATPRVGEDASSTKVSLPGSSVVGESGRSRLWTEIREMQRKSRTPTEASKDP